MGKDCSRAFLAREFANPCFVALPLLLIMMAITAGGASAAPAEAVLHSFQGGSDGSHPNGNLLVDSKGALYGLAGAPFKLAPPIPPATKWTKTNLGVSADSLNAIDSGGRLYGIKTYSIPICAVYLPDGECAGLYDSKAGVSADQFTPPASGSGKWNDTVIWSDSVYCHYYPPYCPVPRIGSLTLDPSGKVYFARGVLGVSVTVSLATPPSGTASWALSDLYSFNGGSDGDDVANLMFDASGTLYGTTPNGGTFGQGTLFKLTPPPGGGTPWIKTVLYNFAGGSDGGLHYGSMAFDPSGALYAPAAGGAYGQSRVIKLAPPPGGGVPWIETTLYSFEGGSDGFPVSLLLDASGALYAPTAGGGQYGKGRVIKLTPPQGGGTPWVETTLYSFTGGSDGAYPGPLVSDGSGNLYGTAYSGGSSNCTGGCGVVFQLTGTGFAPSVPFSSFSSKLFVQTGATPPKYGLELLSQLTLGPGASPLNPPAQAVSLQVGPYGVTVPAGSYTQTRFGTWNFDGTVDGVKLHSVIWLTGTKQYQFLADASGANLAGTKNPVPVMLMLGPNSGSANVTGAIYP